MNMCALATVLLIAAGPAPNPCTNGSFEVLAPDGTPVDWQMMGQAGVVDTDAHSGERALRIRRVPDDPARETGLNRQAAHRACSILFFY